MNSARVKGKRWFYSQRITKSGEKKDDLKGQNHKRH